MLQLGHFVTAVSSSEMRPIESKRVRAFVRALIAERDNAGVPDVATKTQLVATATS